MELDDTIIQIAVAGVLSAGALLWFAMGFITSVAGTWHDGQHTVTLEQWGPWVWGEAKWPQGWQRYRGLISFGRLRLRRFDGGLEHLKTLGFNEAQAALLGGRRTMAHLELRRRDDALVGLFYGRRISFETDDRDIAGVAVVIPEKRVWRRQS